MFRAVGGKRCGMLTSTRVIAVTVYKNLYNIGPSTSHHGGGSLMRFHPSLKIWILADRGRNIFFSGVATDNMSMLLYKTTFIWVMSLTPK